VFDRNREGVVASFGYRYWSMKGSTLGVECDPADLVSALHVIGGKWKIQIICLLFSGR
jgi:DNA-binding HxlR family transcriptional regulator